MGEAATPLPIHQDQPAHALDPARQIGDRRLCGFGRRQPLRFHEERRRACERGAQELLPIAGAGNGAGQIVGIDAGSDHGRVADPAAHLVDDPASRRRRRQIAGTITRYCADGAELAAYGRRMIQPRVARRFGAGQLFLPVRRHEI